MHCSVIEHGMTSLSFETVVQKNEVKQFINEMGSYRALFLNKAQLTMF